MAALTKEQVKQLFETLENPIDRNDENEFITAMEDNKDKFNMKIYMANGNTLNHSIARAVHDNYCKLNKIDKCDLCIGKNKKMLGYEIGKQPYEIYNFIWNNENVKKKYKELFKNDYKNIKNGNGYTPNYLAEICNQDFYKFMNSDDNDYKENNNSNITNEIKEDKINRIEEAENMNTNISISFENKNNNNEFLNVFTDSNTSCHIINKTLLSNWFKQKREDKQKYTCPQCKKEGKEGYVGKVTNDKDEEVCLICLDVPEKDSKYEVSSCKHIFHKHEIGEWCSEKENININFECICPVCRESTGEGKKYFQKFRTTNRIIHAEEYDIKTPNFFPEYVRFGIGNFTFDDRTGGSSRKRKSRKSRKSRKTHKIRKSRKTRKHRKSNKHRRSNRR
jgi:hypothetical protein